MDNNLSSIQMCSQLTAKCLQNVLSAGVPTFLSQQTSTFKTLCFLTPTAQLQNPPDSLSSFFFLLSGERVVCPWPITQSPLSGSDKLCMHMSEEQIGKLREGLSAPCPPSLLLPPRPESTASILRGEASRLTCGR